MIVTKSYFSCPSGAPMVQHALPVMLEHTLSNKISIERLIQIPDKERRSASIVIITHKTKEINSRKCLKSIKNNKNIIKNPVLIRLF